MARYLLKDVCKLAQNVFLQALERGDAAGERQNTDIQTYVNGTKSSVFSSWKKKK